MTNSKEQKTPGPSAMTAPQANNGQMVTFKQKVDTVKELLASYRDQIMVALPKHMNVDRVLRIALTTCTQNPQLLECTKASLIKSILQASSLGLEVDGLLGHAYLIPFKNKGKLECQLIPGYKGLLKLARNSGEVAFIEPHVVRIGDEFKYTFGTDPFLKHKPAECPLIECKDEKTGQTWMEPDSNWRPGAITHAYAICKLKDGTSRFEVMQLWEIFDIRDRSKGYQSAVKNGGDNPWITDFPEMAKKSTIRRIAKTSPSSVELQTALRLADQADAGLPQQYNVIDIPGITVDDDEPPPEGSNGDARLDKLAAKAAEASV